jgi:hypothetical protein
MALACSSPATARTYTWLAWSWTDLAVGPEGLTARGVPPHGVAEHLRLLAEPVALLPQVLRRLFLVPTSGNCPGMGWLHRFSFP